MSNKYEKIIDLLKDISKKCDSLKSTPEGSLPIKITCINCKNKIVVTDFIKLKDLIICEICGEENEFQK